MNRHDTTARLDRLLDGLEAEILAASDADVLAALADIGRIRTAVLHAARVAITGEPGDPTGPEDTSMQRLARDAVGVKQSDDAMDSRRAPPRKPR